MYLHLFIENQIFLCNQEVREAVIFLYRTYKKSSQSALHHGVRKGYHVPYPFEEFWTGDF